MTEILWLLLLLFCVFSYRLAWWASAVDYRYPRILMYHMISEHKAGARFNGLRVAPEKFDRQLAWLKDNGWNFVTMSELIASAEPLPEKTVALTFDDGYEDNLTEALPLLQKYNVRATIYLVVDRHDNDWSTKKKAHHDSGELARETKLSDKQVRTLLDSGLIELGGHTLTHANLANLENDEKRREISQCKQQLEQNFNTNVSSFAYPFGIVGEGDPALVEELGYSNAVLAEGGIETELRKNKMKIRRIKISGKYSFLAFRLLVKRGKRGLRK